MSMESITMTSQSPGWDWSTMAKPAPVPSNSLTLTLMPLASSKGLSRAGSAWSHQIRALRSAAAAGEMTAMLAIAAAQALRFSDGINELNMVTPPDFLWLAKKMNQF